MTEPLAVPEALRLRFPALSEKLVVPRDRRVFVEVHPDWFAEVLDFACGELGFDRLVTITGTDDRDGLSALYSLSRPDGVVLSLRVRVPYDRPVLRSVTDRFPGAANYERELVDLLGFELRGLPPGRRYPLPDGWPGDSHPLRKTWKPPRPAPGAKAGA